MPRTRSAPWPDGQVAAVLGVLLVLVATLAGCGSDEAAAPRDAGTRIEATAAPSPSSTASTGKGTARPAAARPATPQRLTLDGQTSRVVPVGIGAAQELEIPGDIKTLGWWTGGAKAGARTGFVVITGHATRDGDGAANAWWSARPGDLVTVGTAGDRLRYRVVSRTTYQKTDIPLARWFPEDGPHGPAGLALITCADYRDGAWQANTVVEAVPV